MRTVGARGPARRRRESGVTVTSRNVKVDHERQECDEIDTENEAPRATTPPSLRIGEVARRTELSLRSLRHWEDVGLLRPSGRSEGGFRLYTDDDVEKILVIRRMKPLGFTLEQMKSVMDDLEVLRSATAHDRERTRAVERLVVVQQEAEGRRSSLARQLRMADEFVDLLGKQLG